MDKIDKFYFDIMTEMLRRKGTTIEEVKERFPEGSKPPWFQYYTWTMAEEEDFKQWAIALGRKRLRFTKMFVTKMVSMFLFNYGFMSSDYELR